MGGLWGQNSAQLRGRVVSEDGEPLVGARVWIPELKVGGYTNDKGIYSISRGISPGEYEVSATYFGYDTLTKEVLFQSNTTTVTVGFALKLVEVYTDAVEITSERKTGEIDKTKVDIGITSITPKEINLIPSLGSADLAQFLQVLPGVVFTGDQGGQLYIRGGTPIQNMVLLDDMVIYSPFHSIGLFSVFDPDYIRSVDVYSAAFPGQYGGRISSVIDIKSKNGSMKQFKAKGNVSPFSAGALLEGPLAKGKNVGSGLSYLISARNNFIDATSPTVYPYVNDSVGLPYNFLDIYGKLTATDGVNEANVFGFRHTDNVNFGFPADIGWEALGFGANFQLLPSTAGAIISGGLAYSDYQTQLTDVDSEFPRASQITGFNGNLKVGYIMNSVNEFNFGLNFLGFTTDYVFTNSFGLQSEQEASNTEAAIHFRYKQVIQEANGDKKPFQRAVIEPSLHMHFYNNQNFFSFEPRLRAKLNFPGLSLNLGWGLYSQNLLAAVSDRDVVNLFQGFLSAPEDLAFRVNNNTLQTASHYLAGVEAQVIPGVTTTVEGWLKSFTQLTNINREKLFPTDPNFITETGLAYGLDFIVKYQTRSTYLYLNYGLARVTRTDRLGPDQTPRTYAPVFDRRHTINLVAAYNLGRFSATDDDNRKVRPKFSESPWEFSLRWGLGSGFPFTQTQGYFEKLDFQDNGGQTDISTQNGQLGILLSDELNGGRLPYYHRLDLSVKRRWVFANKVLLEVVGSAINTYNRQNIFYFDRVRFEAVYQLPIVPSLGVTVKY